MDNTEVFFGILRALGVDANHDKLPNLSKEAK